MKHGSLFNGKGGFQLAAAWIGWENFMSCEIDEQCNYETKLHFPNCIQHEDIRTTDFSIYRGKIDILTGGFPCQPFSVAGQRKGTEDDRHLWPEMLRAIREIQPHWVVGENVRGITNWNGGMVFEQVCADLEAEGYEVQPFILPAAGVNAPHRRDRIWFVAYSADAGFKTMSQQTVNADRLSASSNSSSGGLERRSISEREIKDTSKWTDLLKPIGRSVSQQFVTYGDFQRLERFWFNPPIGWQDKRDFIGSTWDSWPTQPPVRNGDDGLPTQLVRQWLREDSQGLLSEKEIDRIISKATTKWVEETIKGGGNAIVPQVALQIFKAIEQC